MFANLEAWITGSAWPTIKSFFGGVVHDEVAAVTPLAQTAVANLATEEATALTSGNTAEAGDILAKVVGDTASAAKNASIQVGVQSLLTAVGGVVAQAKS
jgi:hypothetical protein